MTTPLSSDTAVSTTGPTLPAKLPLWGLLALSFCVFLSISSEMMPTGLLREMSSSLGVSQANIGLLVTIFAFTVVLTSTLLIRLTRRLPRHRLLIGVLSVLALCNLLTAILPTYELIVAARILGGLAHGIFWAITPAYASRLVAPDQIGRAVTIALTGGTVAMVLGVPLGTALGQAIGWRGAFGAVAIALALGVIAVMALLPRVNAESEPAPVTGAVPVAKASYAKPIALLCATVGFTMIGYYSLFTYITPFLTEQLAVPTALVSVALLLFGLCGALALFFTAGIFSRLPMLGLTIGLIACTLTVSALALTEQTPVLGFIAMGLWGFSFGLIPPLLQTTLLQASPMHLRDTSSSFYTTAFNIGIGGGALVGATLLEGVGISALPMVSAALVGIATVIFLIARPSVRAAVAANRS